MLGEHCFVGNTKKVNYCLKQLQEVKNALAMKSDIQVTELSKIDYSSGF